MYTPPTPSTTEGTEEESWQSKAHRKEAERQARVEEAKQNRVYLAMGPLIGAVVIGNLITGAIGAVLWALLR